MGSFYFGLIQLAAEHLIGQTIHNKESVVLCQLFVHVALLINGALRQCMAQVVPNDLLYGRVGVQAEAQDIVEIRPADGVENAELLRADDSAESRVAADREQLAQRLGVLAV